MKPIWKPGQVYRVESKTSGHVLEVVWTFPCLHKLYQKKPEEYMSHYLGYDSESEPWSGICYSVEDLKDFMKQSTATSEDNASLQFPSKNRFITKNFILCAEDTRDVPTCIVDEQRMKFWYKKDNTFKVPRADIYLRINLKEAYFDVRSSALTEYFIHLLKDELSEVISEAKIAMLEILISFVDGMLELKVSGFNEKLPLLLREVLSKVSSFMPTEERFQLMKNDMKESLMNQDTLFLKTILCEHNYENYEKLSYLDDDLSHDTFKKFIEVLRSEAYIEGLCHENMTEKDANDTCVMIRETFLGNPLPDMSRHVERVVCLPCNADLVMDFNASNLDENLSVAEVYLQFEQDLELASSKWMALFDLFCDIVEGPFFDQLRNQGQRGYDVKCYPLILQSVFGFCFHVKSYRYNPDTLQDRIGNFIETGFFQRFSDISFNNHKTSLVEKLMQKASSLKGESGRLWAEIVEQRSKFDIDIKKAEELKKINKKEMKNWCRKYLKISSRHCKRLTIKCWSATTDMEVDDSESVTHIWRLMIQSQTLTA